MNNQTKQETNRADNEALLLEQIKNLTKLIEELKSKPSSLDGNREKKFEIEAIKFTKKELKEMPRLKDFKIRIKKDKYYEIRFRKYGYNVSFSSTNFEIAKQKAFAWLSVFESQIKPNVNFTVLSKSESDLFSVNKRIVFKTFADNYIYNVKKNMVKPVTFKSYECYYC